MKRAPRDIAVDILLFIAALFALLLLPGLMP